MNGYRDLQIFFRFTIWHGLGIILASHFLHDGTTLARLKINGGLVKPCQGEGQPYRVHRS